MKMENGFPKINFSDSINSSSIKSFIHTLEDLCAQHPEAKTLVINIYYQGGDVDLSI